MSADQNYSFKLQSLLPQKNKKSLRPDKMKS